MVLKINKDYFKNLAAGEHSLKVHFKDGYAEGTFEVKNKITFTILDTAFTATEGMTWDDWLMSFCESHYGNGIVWVSNERQLYIDTRYEPSWSQGMSLGVEEDALYDSNDIRQTLSTAIVNGATYGRSSDCPT
jgi:hypothetical protein